MPPAPVVAPSHPRSRALWATAWAAIVAVPLLLIPIGDYRLDLDVYRIGAQVLLAGGDLYGPMPPTQIGLGLPFTYPPFAAFLFVPLTWVPLSVASFGSTVLSVAAMIVCAVVLAHELGWRRQSTLLLLTGMALLLGPVRETFGLGQVTPSSWRSCSSVASGSAGTRGSAARSSGSPSPSN